MTSILKNFPPANKARHHQSPPNRNSKVTIPSSSPRSATSAQQLISRPSQASAILKGLRSGLEYPTRKTLAILGFKTRSGIRYPQQPRKIRTAENLWAGFSCHPGSCRRSTVRWRQRSTKRLEKSLHIASWAASHPPRHFKTLPESTSYSSLAETSLQPINKASWSLDRAKLFLN